LNSLHAFNLKLILASDLVLTSVRLTFKMKKLRAILIDDESSSRRALRQKLVHYCPDIEVVAECKNAEEGIKTIKERNPDLIFLNIEMPGMNGFEMLQKLNNQNFDLILTSACGRHAINAIPFRPWGYLVKPIQLNELLAALNRVKKNRNQIYCGQGIKVVSPNNDKKLIDSSVCLHSMKCFEFVAIHDIVFLEAASNYTNIYLQSFSCVTASKTLKYFEELLPLSVFVRIHHSWIINKNHLQKYLRGRRAQVLMSNGKILNVARRKKESFLKVIGTNFLVNAQS